LNVSFDCIAVFLPTAGVYGKSASTLHLISTLWILCIFPIEIKLSPVYCGAPQQRNYASWEILSRFLHLYLFSYCPDSVKCAVIMLPMLQYYCYLSNAQHFCY